MPGLSLGCVLGNKLLVGESMNHLLVNTVAASTSDDVTLSQDYYIPSWHCQILAFLAN